jgi:hypothetical protein
MTVTYVAGSAAAVLVAEAIILALALSQAANARHAGGPGRRTARARTRRRPPRRPPRRPSALPRLTSPPPGRGFPARRCWPPWHGKASESAPAAGQPRSKCRLPRIGQWCSAGHPPPTRWALRCRCPAADRPAGTVETRSALQKSPGPGEPRGTGAGSEGRFTVAGCQRAVTATRRIVTRLVTRDRIY